MEAFYTDFPNFRDNFFQEEAASYASLMLATKAEFLRMGFELTTKEAFDIAFEIKYGAERRYKIEQGKTDEDENLGLTTFKSLVDHYDNKLFEQIKTCVREEVNAVNDVFIDRWIQAIQSIINENK